MYLFTVYRFMLVCFATPVSPVIFCLSISFLVLLRYLLFCSTYFHSSVRKLNQCCLRSSATSIPHSPVCFFFVCLFKILHFYIKNLYLFRIFLVFFFNLLILCFQFHIYIYNCIYIIFPRTLGFAVFILCCFKCI